MNLYDIAGQCRLIRLQLSNLAFVARERGAPNLVALIDSAQNDLYRAEIECTSCVGKNNEPLYHP